ncbi:unnamed protein product [Cylicocyclus nassatus]|uniref:Uncharacterized protein n=1 Tax=Cylicocyclus nassatus TaxID=53992 RepID=A0AA36DRY6_CYLNA|nr:unnamed protein product [Cylicocyclus nassatus]
MARTPTIHRKQNQGNGKSPRYQFLEDQPAPQLLGVNGVANRQQRTRNLRELAPEPEFGADVPPMEAPEPEPPQQQGNQQFMQQVPYSIGKKAKGNRNE